MGIKSFERKEPLKKDKFSTSISDGDVGLKYCSESLSIFRGIIKCDFKKRTSEKREKEKKELLTMFVSNCPSRKGPELADKFKDYGISSTIEFKRLKSRILINLGLKKDETYKYFTQICDMEKQVDKIKDLYASKKKKLIFFAKGEDSEMDSLFIRIRNSFAHGNFFKKRDYYYLWNESGSNNKPKKLASFMVLKFEDLKQIFNSLKE